MKFVLTLTALLFASTAFAGPILKNADGDYQQVSNMMLNGFSFQPGEVCVDGSKIETLVAKSARFPVLNEDSETIGYRTRTMAAGKRFEWKNRVSKVRDEDGNVIGTKKWTQNLAPAWSVKTCGSFDAFDRDYQGPHKCVSERVLIPNCDEATLPPVPAN